MYDISSLIIERGGTERAMVGSLVGGSSPSGMWRSPCFLMWSSCESDLHNCAYDSHSLFAILFPIPLILPWTLLLLFLFSIYCPKLNSSAVSLCRFLSITRLFNFPLSWFLICLNVPIALSAIEQCNRFRAEQSVFCLFINREGDFCPFRQLTHARKHFCGTGLLPSFTLSSANLCLIPPSLVS